MAQLGLAVAGAAVGSATGIKGAAGWGWLAGSLLGGLLFAPNQQGPRLRDSESAPNVYGQAIPTGYGTARYRLYPIWGTGLIEKKHKDSAKGGSVTTYTYSSSFAGVFAHRSGATAKLLRVLIDGKPVYDVRGTDAGATSEISSKDGFRFTFYDGTQSTPDGLMESYLGSGNVPIYKDLVYMVVESLDVTDYAGQAYPLVEAEISFNATAARPYDLVEDFDYTFLQSSGKLLLDPVRPYLYAYSLYSMQRIKTTDYSTEGEVSVLPALVESPATLDDDGYLWYQGAGGVSEVCYQVNPRTWTMVGRVGEFSHNSPGGWKRIPGPSFILPATIQNHKVCVAIGALGVVTVWSRTLIDSIDLVSYQFFGKKRISGLNIAYSNTPFPQIVQDRDGYFWTLINETLVQIFITIGENPDPASYPGSTHVASINYLKTDLSAYITQKTFIGNPNSLIYYADDHSLLLYGDGALDGDNTAVAKYDIDSGTITAEYANASYGLTASHYANSFLGVQNGKIIAGGPTGITILDATDLSVVAGPYTFSNWAGLSYNSGFVWHEPTNSVYVSRGQSSDDLIHRLYLDRLAGAGEDLADIVQDICEQTGRLAASDINVTSLSGTTVRGYQLARQMNAAAAIGPLRQGFFFDGYESDWKLKFTLRAGASAFTLDEAHLAESHDGWKFPEISRQESELPYKVLASYFDHGRGLLENTQKSSRRSDAISTTQEDSLQLPIVFTASEAKRITEILLYSLWAERVTHPVVLPWYYLALDPSDIGTITVDGVDYTLRIESVDLGANLEIQLAAVQTDDETYSSTVTGDSGQGTGNEPTLPQPIYTELFIFDIPLLRDVDYTNGTGVPIYIAVAPYNSTWDGATVYRSQDQSDFDSLFAIFSELTWGYATTALHNATRANGFEWWATLDKIGTLTVKLERGSLASVTQTQMLNGANAALLQNGDNWELIQFQTVVDNGDGTYTLSKLLRGQRGTNKWIGEHVAGDFFILLDNDTVKKYVAPNGDISATRYYKGVANGSDFYGADWELFTLAANAYKPYSPQFIHGERDGSNNLTITWKRRTRAGGEWLMDGTNNTVPLSEESEAYEVDILNSSGTVVRTISSLTSPTATYTAAEQTTDFGSAQSEISVKVYQINTNIDRGFAGEATV